jgi:hypothetical protein
MKTYEGRRTGHAVDVTVNGKPLDPRLDLWNHSPSGFEWGYAGSGPTQLSLALLSDHFGDDDQALVVYQRFKWQVVVKLPRRRWMLTGREIDEAVQAIREKEHAGGSA